ncbi:hypothetical protein CC86DRAFT_461711 [Ophiobolus disseminans]|uniref:Heterokaryon incompatibility domain-containing protein n=1 Tax=Ophiobolus disseminans TaxID=1469910 RepID=A0A6A7AL40_9PLEO|nr:hypothetical protein CC86DRAFT_461711 [Ophiobolus disseminans]
MDTSYVYQDLPSPSSIRLLHLEPGAETDPIRCTFTFTIIDLRPEVSVHQERYEAVSYVWGNASNVEPITCAGAVLNIPKTLAAVLRRIRLHGSTRVLWADAACINQRATEEKNQQVQIMGAVFRQASQVLFVLQTDKPQCGYSPIDDAPLKDLFSELLGKCPLQLQLFASTGHYSGHMPDPLPTHVFRDSTSPGWYGRFDATGNIIRAMLGTAWFQRAWIAQEFGVSRDGTFIYGHHEIPKEILYAFVVIFGTFGYEACRFWNVQDVVQRAFNLLTAYKFLNMGRLEVQKFDHDKPLTTNHPSYEFKDLSFLDILYKLRDSGIKATLPVDHLYAFLGHPRITGGNDPPVIVDYKRPVAETFLDFASSWVMGSGDLQILSCVYHRDSEDLERGVSWVPRWEIRNHCIQLGGLMGTFLYSAGRSPRLASLAQPTVVSSDKLEVKGYVIGCIAFTPIKLTGNTVITYPNANFGKFWSKLLECTRDTIHPPPTHQTVISLLTGGNPGDWPLSSTPLFFSESSQLSVVPLQLSVPYLIPVTDSLTVNAVRICRGRRIFGTDNGKLGLGPEIMKEGDVCCILYGGHVPVILRETTAGEYRLVGEAYVEGCMDGALNEVQFAERTTRKFVIV